MAAIAMSATTVIQYDVSGGTRTYTCDYAATTAAGSDTVQTPLSVVDYVNVTFVGSSAAALTTATIIEAQPLAGGQILVNTSTHNNLTARYKVWGH